jgi:hypothetical protein
LARLTSESLFGRSDPHFQQRLHQVGEVRFVAKAFLLYGVFLQESAFLDIGWILRLQAGAGDRLAGVEGAAIK